MNSSFLARSVWNMSVQTVMNASIPTNCITQHNSDESLLLIYGRFQFSCNDLRRVWQLSGYEISAAIHCKPLQLFVRQQSTLAASADERDVSLSTKMAVAACKRRVSSKNSNQEKDFALMLFFTVRWHI